MKCKKCNCFELIQLYFYSSLDKNIIVTMQNIKKQEDLIWRSFSCLHMFLKFQSARSGGGRTNNELFWLRRLCVRHTRWCSQCVAGYCYYHRSVSLFLLAQAALCAPPEMVFAMCSWPLLLPSFSLSIFFSPSFAFDPLRGNSRGCKK